MENNTVKKHDPSMTRKFRRAETHSQISRNWRVVGMPWDLCTVPVITTPMLMIETPGATGRELRTEKQHQERGKKRVERWDKTRNLFYTV